MRLPAESACHCCVQRRRFLRGCAACGAAALLPGDASSVLRAEQPAAEPRPRVRLVFACWALVQDRPTWPHIGHDMRPEIERVTNALQTGCPEIEFLPVAAHGPEDADRLLAMDEQDRVDGYIVYQMNNWVQVFPKIVASGKPTIVADFLFAGSGGFLRYTAGLRRQHRNFSVVSSSRIEDLVEAARCFAMIKTSGTDAFVAACDRLRQDRTAPANQGDCAEDRITAVTPGECLESLKQAKILSVGGGSRSIAESLYEIFGITVEFPAFEELAAMCEAVEETEAEQVAETWRRGARRIAIDEPEQTLLRSARNYLGQKKLLESKGAEAITINCLGGFYSGKLQAYPCLGFVELLNAGLIGACEADLLSTGTMVAMRHLVGRPGYISDPVLDTSKREIIYAHCVAMTKPLGQDGPANDYEILSHSEDRRGASVRSFLPLGYRISTMEIHPVRKEILFHQGRAEENVIEDRACRTKLACHVEGDFEKLFHYWDTYGWHRVSFYGDLREPTRELAAAIGFQFVEEA